MTVNIADVTAANNTNGQRIETIKIREDNSNRRHYPGGPH